MRRSGMVHLDFINEKIEIKSVRFISNKTLGAILCSIFEQILIEFIY